MAFRDVKLTEVQKKKFAEQGAAVLKGAGSAKEKSAELEKIAAKAKVHQATIRYWVTKKFKLV